MCLKLSSILSKIVENIAVSEITHYEGVIKQKF
jgi:hypothetical protein